ncbi:MAG: hypothetical protein ACRDIB_19885, partial [Ardenticatenaceae bacterium]
MNHQRLIVCLVLLLALLLVGCRASGREVVEGPRATAVPNPTFTPPAVEESTPTEKPVAITATVEPTPGEVAEAVATPTVAPAEVTPVVPISPPERDPDHPFASPEYGMQAFMWWRPEVADRDLKLLMAAGFNWVKQDFAWREIEGLG